MPGAQQGTATSARSCSPRTEESADSHRSAAGAASGARSGDSRDLIQDIQGLKKDVVDLDKDLFILEEELLFPANTQVAVFLSVDVGQFLASTTVQLKMIRRK